MFREANDWRMLGRFKYVILVLAASIGLTSRATADTPFMCTGDIYQVQSGQLRVFDPTLSQYRDIGPVNATYNAIGYSSVDNFIYGLRNADLVRIDATGTLTTLFSLPFTSASADMDNSNNLWVQRSANLLTRVNVVTGVSTDLALTGGTIPSGTFDIAFVSTVSGDRIIAIGSSSMALINPVTGQTVSYSVASLPTGSIAGATWADATGRVFTFKNGSGNVYEIRGYLTSSPFAVLVAKGQPSNSNDGASCRAKPFPNLAPVALDDIFTTPFQTARTGNVLADNGNGVDLDPEGSALTVAASPVVNVANGSLILAANGSFTYTPVAGFSGIDQFTYRITDASGLTATAIVKIAVTKAALSLRKSSSLYASTASSPFLLPQNEVIYAIEITNDGNQSADSGSVFLVDPLPPDVTFYNDDIDQGGPDTFAGTNPVAFVDAGSGLTFTYATDVGFSNQAAAPTSLAQCTYAPAAGYDPAVRFLCINPKGALLPNGAKATVYFRVQIK
jgi:uncharacterized repeat protein (TIGR01451 family)